MSRRDLSQHDLAAALTGPAALPCDAAGPVFAEPWQGQAFAMVVALHERGLFTWSEWATALSREIKHHGGEDDGTHYYECWLHALEEILIDKGATDHRQIDDLAQAWAEAAENTPHGKAIELPADTLTSQVGAAITSR